MNIEFLKKAHERVPSVPVLVNLISKREKQLIAGEKPLVMPQTGRKPQIPSPTTAIRLSPISFTKRISPQGRP